MLKEKMKDTSYFRASIQQHKQKKHFQKGPSNILKSIIRILDNNKMERLSIGRQVLQVHFLQKKHFEGFKSMFSKYQNGFIWTPLGPASMLPFGGYKNVKLSKMPLLQVVF